MPYGKDIIRKTVGFTPDEWAEIRRKAEASKMKEGAYIKKAAVKCEVKVYDMSDLVNLMRSFNAIGNNLNQIAKVVNSTGSVYKKDIDEMKESFDYFDDVMKNYLRELVPEVK